MDIVCLANSFKYQGRCIAGIDLQSGSWVRPVSYKGSGKIPTASNLAPVDKIKILDILRISVDGRKKLAHEVENVGYKNLPWQIIGQAGVAHLLQYCETEILFSNYGRAIPYAYLEMQAPVRTLQLLEVKSFVCYSKSQGKWRGVIADEKYGFGDVEMSITDPVALAKLNRGETLSSHCLICLSLGQPWQPDGHTSLQCYRLVAGIVELLPELELIVQEMERRAWTLEQGKQYLKEKFGKSSRYQLTAAEAKQFLLDLRQ